MFVILDTIFLSLILLTHNVSIRAYFNVEHIIDSWWISFEFQARNRQNLSTLKAWMMTEYKKCKIPKKAAWVRERNWPRWEVPNGQEKPDHGENKGTGQQEEVQTEMRFTGVAYQRSQESTGWPIFTWWQENADFAGFATEWVTRVGKLRKKKNVRAWKNVITWML